MSTHRPSQLTPGPSLTGVVSVDEFLFEDDEVRAPALPPVPALPRVPWPTLSTLSTSTTFRFRDDEMRHSAERLPLQCGSASLGFARARVIGGSACCRVECAQIDDLVDQGLMSRNYCTACMYAHRPPPSV